MNKNILNTAIVVAITSLSLAACSSSEVSGPTEKLDYKVVNGSFITSEGHIPSACFAQLMIDLNGDDTVAAVYINRTVLRGCINSNIPYPGGNGQETSYSIEKDLGNNKFKIFACEQTGGSMGNHCSNIIIQFKNRVYISPDGNKKVLSVEKLGEW